MVLLADMPCTPGMKPDMRNGSGHRHRSIAVGTDPQRDGRGKPAECLCPDDAPAWERIQCTQSGWRDAGLDGPHPKMNPGRVPLAAVPPGVRGTLPRSDAEAVPGEGRCADPEGCAGALRPSTRKGCACCWQQEAQVRCICLGRVTA